MKLVIRSMMLPIIAGIVTMAALPGCSGNDALHGMVIPVDFVYDGKTYRNAGETVAIEIADDTTETTDNLIHIGPVLYKGLKYDVFSIRDLDVNEAIAIKFMLVGETGAFYYYFKYQRQ